MKFFIDSADVKEIRLAQEMGCVDGVTTNPTLLAKVGLPREATIKEICRLVDGPISAEAVSVTGPALIEEGRALAKLHKNVVVKIPMGSEGMKAVRELSADGIRTNVTLVFSPAQALLSAKAGATYVSPFVGRLDDIAQNGMDLVRDIKLVFDNYGFKTQILVASIRHPIHLMEAARIGAHVATLPLQVIFQLAEHPLTQIGIQKFLSDWEKVPK